MQNKLFIKQSLVILLLILLVGLPSYVIYQYRVMSPTNNDYETHIEVVQSYLTDEPVPKDFLLHPILQFLLIGISWVTFGVVDYQEGMILILVASNVLLALIIYGWFGKSQSKHGNWLRVFWACTLPFITPIMVLAVLDHRFYFGYIALANYHNPTIQLLRPFALLLFILAVCIFSKQKSSIRMLISGALLTVFTALIKPNLILCLIPALLILCLWQIIQKMECDRRLLIFGFLLPAALILSWQYSIQFGQGSNSDASILFAPLAVEGRVSNFLWLKILLSLFFPLVILILNAKEILSSNALKLAWLTFLAGAAQLYLFAEGGQEFKAANFRWGAQIGLFLLFIATARFVYLKTINGHQLTRKKVTSFLV